MPQNAFLSMWSASYGGTVRPFWTALGQICRSQPIDKVGWPVIVSEGTYSFVVRLCNKALLITCKYKKVSVEHIYFSRCISTKHILPTSPKYFLVTYMLGTYHYKRTNCSALHTIGSSVFFWNWTNRTLVTFSMSMSPLALSGESPFKYGEVGGGVTLNASSL